MLVLKMEVRAHEKVCETAQEPAPLRCSPHRRSSSGSQALSVAGTQRRLELGHGLRPPAARSAGGELEPQHEAAGELKTRAGRAIARPAPNFFIEFWGKIFW